MHHPHQFNVMAKSIQDDRLRAAAASRASKKAQSRRFNWQSRLRWPSWQRWLDQIVGRVSASFGLGIHASE